MYPVHQVSLFIPWWAQHSRRNIRGVRLEDVCNTSNEQAANESVVPNVLPTLLHVLLAGLNAKEVPSRGVIVIAVVGAAAEVGSRGEALNVLRAAANAAGANAV